ncbi:MAG: porin [Gammaproteobacteria bacterium]|nr:porin [Gammaproteobacteria bacterium]
MALNLLLPSSRHRVLAACALSLFTTALPAAADSRQEQLEQKVDALAKQLEALQAELRALKAEAAATSAATSAQAPAPTQTPASTAAVAAYVDPSTAPTRQDARAAAEHREAFLSGYGEVNYNHYDHDSSRDEATVRRAVFGIGYRFNDSTSLVSEFETENAVVSADDGGEFEVEQFYIDHRYNEHVASRIGLILIPIGYLNTAHEPTRYFGVERNNIETRIIPSTEREGGISLYGRTGYGLSYDLGLTTSFNLANWDFGSAEGAESPLGSIHGELTNSRAADLAQYVSLNYDGIAGLNFGGSVFTGEVGQNQDVGVSASPRFLLWESHARYVHGPLQLQALYAHGGFSDTAALNLANAGALTPIPKAFYGWYAQGAYRVWRSGDYALTPFVRFERYNTGADYANQPAGFGSADRLTETVLTSGASFYLTPNVVLKADYQHYRRASEDNRFNLGLGLQFY